MADPLETMKLLRKYRALQNEERLRLGEYYQYQGFVFSQDNGKPMHPDGVTTWLDRFSKRHDLPHINPHAFRHPNVKPKTQNNLETTITGMALLAMLVIVVFSL